MEKKNVVKDKSFDFAIEIVALFRELKRNNEYVLSKQLLRSGTSIGANVREAEFAQSKRDFVSKMSIALKEANEVDYWLDLLFKTQFLDFKTFHSYKEKSTELIKILVKIVKNSKE